MIAIPYYETSNFVFSNFSPHSVTYKGLRYPTVEHAYHAQKFDDPNLKEQIRNCGSPLEAWTLARELTSLQRSDWGDHKVETLTDLIRSKALQHEEVRAALLATGEDEIVEINPSNDFWGNGPNGQGHNHMGKILMRIRAELRTQV